MKATTTGLAVTVIGFITPSESGELSSPLSSRQRGSSQQSSPGHTSPVSALTSAMLAQLALTQEAEDYSDSEGYTESDVDASEGPDDCELGDALETPVSKPIDCDYSKLWLKDAQAVTELRRLHWERSRRRMLEEEHQQRLALAAAHAAAAACAGRA